MLDNLLLFYYAKQQYHMRTFNIPTLSFLFGAPLVLFLLLLNFSLVQKALICMLLLPITVYYVWGRMIEQEERTFIISKIKRVTRVTS